METLSHILAVIFGIVVLVACLKASSRKKEPIGVGANEEKQEGSIDTEKFALLHLI